MTETDSAAHLLSFSSSSSSSASCLLQPADHGPGDSAAIPHTERILGQHHQQQRGGGRWESWGSSFVSAPLQKRQCQLLTSLLTRCSGLMLAAVSPESLSPLLHRICKQNPGSRGGGLMTEQSAHFQLPSGCPCLDFPGFRFAHKKHPVKHDLRVCTRISETQLQIWSYMPSLIKENILRAFNAAVYPDSETVESFISKPGQDSVMSHRQGQSFIGLSSD